jgi:hypothetical protein
LSLGQTSNNLFSLFYFRWKRLKGPAVVIAAEKDARLKGRRRCHHLCRGLLSPARLCALRQPAAAARAAATAAASLARRRLNGAV